MASLQLRKFYSPIASSAMSPPVRVCRSSGFGARDATVLIALRLDAIEELPAPPPVVLLSLTAAWR